jgi:hypothetical protein
MISVPDKIAEALRDATVFSCVAKIYFTNGSSLTVDRDAFMQDGNRVVEGAGATSLPLGVAVERTIQLSLMNDTDYLGDYDFYNARIVVYIPFYDVDPATVTTTPGGEEGEEGVIPDESESPVPEDDISNTLVLDGGAEIAVVPIGEFTVIDPVSYGDVVTITAVDNMYKADCPYTTSLTFPVSLGNMYLEICDSCDIYCETSVFPNSDFMVKTAPSGTYTFREVIGYIAMLAGGNASISRYGLLRIVPYDFSEESVQTLEDWICVTVGTDDIVVSGIQTTRTTTNSDGSTASDNVLYGSAGYVLEVENPLIAGQEEAALKLIGSGVMGVTFRKFEGDYISYPLAEFMDVVEVVDRKGNAYRSVITDIDFTFCGITAMSNSAEAAIRNTRTYTSAATKAAREATNAEAESREKLSNVMYDLELLKDVYLGNKGKDTLQSSWIDLKW